MTTPFGSRRPIRARSASDGSKKPAKKVGDVAQPDLTSAAGSVEAQSDATDSSTRKPTPAERSAAAAKHNVPIQKRRFTISVIAAIPALLTLLVTWWYRFGGGPEAGL